MRRRGTKATVTTLIVAGAMVAALLAVGTVLRMRTNEMSFAEAFTSFVSDTFRFQ